MTRPPPRPPTRRSSTSSPTTPRPGLALRQVQLFRRADEAGPDALAAAEAAPDDVAAQTRAADFLLGTGNVQGGVRPPARRRGGAPLGRTATRPAEHLVELFAVVGDDDPRVGCRPPCSSPSRFSDGRTPSSPPLANARGGARDGVWTPQFARVAAFFACRKLFRKAPTSSKPDADVFGKTSLRMPYSSRNCTASSMSPGLMTAPSVLG